MFFMHSCHCTAIYYTIILLCIIVAPGTGQHFTSQERSSKHKQGTVLYISQATNLASLPTIWHTHDNLNQVRNFNGVGYHLATHLAWVSGLNLIKLKFLPNSSEVFHQLVTSSNLADNGHLFRNFGSKDLSKRTPDTQIYNRHTGTWK